MNAVLQKGFEGATLKVKRANRHINEFKHVVDALSGIPANSLSISKQPDGSETVDFASLGEAGAQIALIMGDAIHNLRAAFDHLWLALHRTTSDTGKPGFPFHATRQNLEDMIAKSPVKAAFAEVEKLILDYIKPHRDRGGNEAVWAITHFDNIDKHNLIIPIVNVHRVDMVIKTAGGGSISFSGCTFSGNSGAFISSDTPLEYESEGEVTLDIIFPKDDVFSGQSVLPTLVNMLQATSKSVNLFRDTFLQSI